jgi:hypothetical protein
MDDDDRSASRWLPGLFAARELIIGGGAIADSTRGRDPYPALIAISAVDAIESLLLLEALRRRELPRARALGFVLADLGSATAFPIVLKRLLNDSIEPRPAGSPVVGVDRHWLLSSYSTPRRGRAAFRDPTNTSGCTGRAHRRDVRPCTR